MFACVTWTGPGFDQRVLAMLPDRQLACYFMPNALLFRVPSVAAFLDVRSRMAALADQDEAFDFMLSLHTTRDTFGGNAYYQLPDNFGQIVGP